MGATQYWNPKLETMPLADLKVWQFSQLQKQLDFAYGQSPYYRRIMDQAKISPSSIHHIEKYFEHMPFIKKGDIIQNQQENPGQ